MWLSSLPTHGLGLVSTAALLLLPAASSLQIQSAPAPNIDISQLGRVAFAGAFDSASLYNYVGQNEDGLSTNGTQYIFARYPDGSFAKIDQADASIMSMCNFAPNGQSAGVIIAGNFTSVGNQQSLAAAMLNPNSLALTPLPGLNGQVNSVLCAGNTAYFGGSFVGGNSTNAISWTTGWTNLPFSGFNGPVHSIAELSNGHIVYGGSFTGLGSVSTVPKIPNAQVVNVGSANISSYPNTTTHSGLSDPRNIICRTDNDSSSAWLLEDENPGFWRADFGFTFTPTKLRLYNAQVDGYGTKTWRYTFYPTSGIANFTYYDGQGLQSCQSECPLPQNNNTYQDFYFVNAIPMMGFRIDISAWYGNGGGLGGIELFEDDIYSFAVQAFNEPSCDHVSYGSNSTVQGPWNTAPAGEPGSQYLSAYLMGGTTSGNNTLSVDFVPDIQQSGNYSIQIWTPGCLTDNTCSSRGTVNVTGMVTPEQTAAGSGNVTAQVTQTNNYDKYNEVYYGYMDANTDSFKSRITLTPTQGQNGPLTVVAWKIQFVLRDATNNGLNGSLNGLFEYDPTQANQTADLSTSAIDKAGASLDENALISSVAVVGNDVYTAGNFSGPGFSNVMVIQNGNATSLPGQGLNSMVQAMYFDGQTTLYMGGNFTSSGDNATKGLSNVAAFSTSGNAWQPLGAGVNGVVFTVVPLNINISSTENVPAIAFSGYFNQIQAFGSNAAIPVNNIAVWVPSHGNWLQNIGPSASLIGQLMATVNVPGTGPLFAGTVDYQSESASGVMGLTDQSGFALETLPIKIQPEQAETNSMQQKRATTTHSQVNGVVAGLFYETEGLNITVLGGHFTTTASNGSTIQNLAFINGSSNNQVNGLTGNGSSNEAILAFDSVGTSLFAGGSIPNGFVEYDLKAAQLANPQPPALQGGSGTVQAVASRPSSSIVYFGGDFQSAGSLGCAAFCMYDTSEQQWNIPGKTSFSDDSVVNVIIWSSSTQAILAGNMSIGGNRTALASFNPGSGVYTPYQDAGNPSLVPGPIAALTATDESYSSFFAAGVATNGSAFIVKFTGSNKGDPIGGSWTTAITPDAFGPATVVESVQIMSATNSHASTPLIDSDHILLVTGILQMPVVGNVSAATFNGTTFSPFILSTMDDGSPGTIRAAFVQNPGALLTTQSTHYLALGLVVLIALALALACVFLMALLIIAWEWYKRRREGYVPAPTSMPGFEKPGRVGDISPEQLFGNVRPGSRGGSLE